MPVPIILLTVIILGALAAQAAASPSKTLHARTTPPPLLPPATSGKKTRRKPLVSHTLTPVVVLYPPGHPKAGTPVLTKKRDAQGKPVIGKDGKPILVPLTRDTVSESPDELRAQAQIALGRPISEDVYFLATMLPSEIGGKYLKDMSDTQRLRAKIAIAWVTRNKAAAEGVSIRELLVPYAYANGRFGEQTYKVYASTRFPPTEEDIEAAEAVMRSFQDPTQGALHFDAPRAQDELWAKGRVDKNAEQVAETRRKDKFYAIPVPGIDINILRLWTKHPRSPFVS